jgi:hypothetical protein
MVTAIRGAIKSSGTVIHELQRFDGPPNFEYNVRQLST